MLLITVFLGIATAGADVYLLERNIQYSRQNRELLLKNDSVLSVNLELANELKRLKKTTGLAKSSGAITIDDNEN